MSKAVPEVTQGHHPQNIKEINKELAPTKADFNDKNNDLTYLAQFVPPTEGTPAAAALQANAEVKISRLAKGIRKIKGIKHPKVKNVTKGFKRKKKDARFSRNFKGKVIDGVHELYTLTAGMMLGMRCAIGRSNPVAIPQLTLGDFSYVEKISFPPNGNSHGPFRTPPHSLAHTFKFKTYAPLVFSRIRDFFGVDSSSYMLSVCGNYNYLEFISNSKSGQFFFYSHDGRYLIKTQTNEENKFMKRILPHYYRYVTEHPHTFLARIYGMHRVKMYHLNRKVHFVIMGSVFDTPSQINTIYDLKGSLVGRSATPAERESGGVLKDNDLLADGVKLKLGSKRDLFLSQIEKDATFLSELNIMDYSLLVGIHHRSSRYTSSTQEIKPVPSCATEENLPPNGPALNHAHSNTPFRHKDPSMINPPSSNNNNNNNNSSNNNNNNKDTTTKQLVSMEKGSSNTVTVPPQDVGALPQSNPTLRPRAKSISGQGKQTRRSSNSLSSPMKLNGVVQLELTESVEQQIREEMTIQQSYDSHSDASAEGDDEDDEEDGDEGDSDVEFDEEALKKIYAAGGSEWLNSGSGGIVYSPGGGSVSTSSGLINNNLTKLFDKEIDEDGDQEEKSVMQRIESLPESDIDESNQANSKVASMAGLGLSGEEGRALRALINPREDLTQMSRDAEKELQTEKRVTFGPGAAKFHPWSSRIDGGINSRLSNEKRGDEIYFVGIIDILQQYNASKRMETFFKGFTHDRTQISSVDSVSYAKRFVTFLRENTC